MRVTSVALTLVLFFVVAYCMFVVWSYCEDLKVGGGKKGLPLLARYAEEEPVRKKLQKSYDSLLPANPAAAIIAHDQNVGGPSFGGGKRIFSGRYHETSFP